jgi:putative transposase
VTPSWLAGDCNVRRRRALIATQLNESREQAHDFLSAHALIRGDFHPRRHLMATTACRAIRSTAFNIWQQEACAQRPA